MKKVFGLVFMFLFIFSGFGVSAVTMPEKDTNIVGIIYNADYSSVVSGADVTIECNNLEKYAVSRPSGVYRVVYSDSECGIGDTVTVTAVKGDLFGTATGLVEDFTSYVNFAIINVPMTPEFGFVVGALTLFSAVGIFFVVKRRD